MLIAKGITKTYELKQKQGWFKKVKQSVHAVKGLDLTINRGEIVGLLGLNGAGKTTTIKMLSTLLTPTSGSISIDDHDVVKDARFLKQKVNMIAGGERMLYFRLTGRENLEYFGRLYGIKGGELHSRIGELIKHVGLEDAQDTPVERYSKGMKQRLQIARGLMNNPDYLFLDEPTLGLDAPIAHQLRQTVKSLARDEGKGILLTSHYLEEVEELCDRVYIIDKGEVIMHDTPERVIEEVVKDYRVVLSTSRLTDGQTQSILKDASKKHIHLDFSSAEEGSFCEAIAPFDPTQLIIEIIMKHNLPIYKFESKLPRLEDAIIQLTKERAV